MSTRYPEMPINKPLRFSPPVIASLALIAASYIALLAIIATSPHHPVYDEGWYLGTIALLRQDGLSVDFLRHLPGPAGPTFTIVYAAAAKLLGPGLPWLRFVGFAFLLASSALLAAILAALNLVIAGTNATTSRLLLAGMFLMLPTVAVSSGMTLTEIPAVSFALIATLALAVNDRRGGSPVACLIAGLALGRPFSAARTIWPFCLAWRCSSTGDNSARASDTCSLPASSRCWSAGRSFWFGAGSFRRRAHPSEP